MGGGGQGGEKLGTSVIVSTMKMKLKNKLGALASVPQLVAESLHGPKKGHRFNSRSGHKPGLWVQSLVGAHVRRQPVHVYPSH